ncbi:hypothetical protein D3C76_1771290 [compost metagenome]
MVCPLQQYSPVVIARSNDSLMNAVDFCTAKFRHTEMGKLLIFDYSNSVKMRVYQDSPLYRAAGNARHRAIEL